MGMQLVSAFEIFRDLEWRLNGKMKIVKRSKEKQRHLVWALLPFVSNLRSAHNTTMDTADIARIYSAKSDHSYFNIKKDTVTMREYTQ